MSRPFMRKLNPFKPSDYTGCQLWLDGADPNGTGRRPASGTVLTSWTDKSGSGNTVTLPSLTYSVNTFTGYPGVVFTSGTASSQLTLSPYDCFFASSYTSSLFPISYPGLLGQTAVVMFGNYWQSANFMANGGGFNTNGLNTYGNYVADARNMTVSDVYSLPSSTFALRVGSGDQYPNNSWLGHIYEVIVFSNALNTRQRQQVEGYMCQKWGTVSYLPAGHPGRTGVIYPHNLLIDTLITGQPTRLPFIRLLPNLALPSNTITNGLIAYFLFNGTLLDSQNTITLSRTGSVSYVAGLRNQAVYLANEANVTGSTFTSNYLTTTYNLPTVFTVSFWFYSTSPVSGYHGSFMFSTYNNPSGFVNNSISVYFQSGNMNCAFNNIQNNGAGFAVSINTWYNATITYNNGSLTLFANGSQSGSTISGTAVLNAGFMLGCGADGGGPYPFAGYIEDLRIYNRILSGSEITSIYNGTG